MEFQEQFTTIDTHTAGEPLRIITGGLPPVPGKTMLEKRAFFQRNWDSIRIKLMSEPRGHNGMYGCVVTSPVSEKTDFGVLFMHNEGYSTMCGHGIIAVVTALIETGYFKHRKTENRLVIDTPAGTITAHARCENSEVLSVSFENVPSFVYQTDVSIAVNGQKLQVDIAFGGAFYGIVRAKDLGTSVSIGQISALKNWGWQIKREIEGKMKVEHPIDKELTGITGIIFCEEPKETTADLRNVTVFADKQIDRSPTGTGTCAQLALRHHRGLVKPHQNFVTEGIVDSQLTGRIVSETVVGPFRAVISEIEGSAFVTGFHRFVFDPTDPLKEGFLIK